MTTPFSARGAHTMNSMLFKPMLRKSIHKKSASHDIVRDAAKTESAEEVTHKGLAAGADAGGGSGGMTASWVPDHRTGIYYPKGHENVLQDVPIGAADTETVNWFS